MPEPDDDLALIVEAAESAGAIARSFFGGVYRRWDKNKGEPVTEADLAIDTFLREKLVAARPGYGWLSEESADNDARLDAEKTFVVDPIDGTVAFLKGRPHFTVSIAIVMHGRPVSAVVLNPVTRECFAASAQGGATRDGLAIHASNRESVEGSRVLAPHSLLEHPVWSQAPNIPWPPMHVEQRNSIAYRLALVAAGDFDAALSLSGKHDWDIAAGDLIVHEAGGRVSDHKGNVLRYNDRVPLQRSLVAAGQPLHAHLLARVSHLNLPER
ncbi:MAG TPA: 3'(2'),5'-bisphosphate nucleotidase CysQ [Rhizomicrobium sp.]|nr:3'(2'),5'-bisphosphate nucleotidase CysQ [Rhizomicrobium sp.]